MTRKISGGGKTACYVGMELSIIWASTVLIFISFSIAWPQRRESVVKESNSMSGSKCCSNCYKKVSSTAQVGDKCPHCGVRWYDEEEVDKRPEKSKTLKFVEGIISKVASCFVIVILILSGIGLILKHVFEIDLS